jgi:signal transduction histidine kinase
MVHDVSVRPLGPKANRLCLLQITDVTVATQREDILRKRQNARYNAVVEASAKLKAMEEQLRQSQKMEAVGQLTGGIAHDFNNLLQGIIGSLDRIKFRISEGRISDLDRFVTGALSSANRAAALTHRLLAFSRRQPVDPKPVDVNQLIVSIQELVRRSLGETIAIEIHLGADPWLVRCDSNQLENAVLNLAINARDAMPDGGTLTIETANVSFNTDQALVLDVKPGDYVLLTVRDTGVGMPESTRARAFDPFFTTKPIGQGTGLGLSMIYGFVRQSDGAVRIESELGAGTVIEIALPRCDEDLAVAVAESSSEDETYSEQGEVVLIVEDEAVVRLLIVETLGDLGYRLLEAADGTAALRILQSPQRVDLLVTDIGLPGLNGRQLADAARTKREGLPILFMTGYAENAASSKFLAPGMQIITKPFDMKALGKRVGEMLSHDSQGIG